MDDTGWRVEFWFDPACPLSRLTARWLATVARHRRVQIEWRVMSLSVLNEGLEVDPEGDTEGYLWIPARVAAAVYDGLGSAALGRFYDALWTEPDGGPRSEMGDLGAALRRADLPAELLDVGFSSAVDPVLRASHAAGRDLVTGAVGTPILAVTGPGQPRRAFFGPVVSDLPDEEDAVRLWDGTLLVTGVSGFRELKT